MAKWFYLVDGQEVGPIEARQLKLLADSGRITPSDIVRREDMANWYKAADMTGLFGPAVVSPAGPCKRASADQVASRAVASSSPKSSFASRLKWSAAIVAVAAMFGLKFAVFQSSRELDKKFSQLLRDLPTNTDKTPPSVQPNKPAASPNVVPWVARTLAALPVAGGSASPDAGETYTDSARGLSIVFPRGWKIKKPLANNEIVIKANRTGNNHKLATLLVKTAKLELPVGTPALTSDQFAATYFSDGRPILDSAADVVDGRSAYWLETESTIFGFPAYMVSYCLVVDDAVFCLEAVIVTQDTDWIDENATDILTAIRSFKIIK